MQDRRSFCAGLAFAAVLGASTQAAAGSLAGHGARSATGGALARLCAYAARALPASLLDDLRQEARAAGTARGAAALSAATAADFQAGRTVLLGGVALSRTELGHWLTAADSGPGPTLVGSAGART